MLITRALLLVVRNATRRRGPISVSMTGFLGLLYGGAMGNSVYGQSSVSEFSRRFISVERSPEISEESDLYAGLLGSWNVDVVDYAADASVQRSRGEWHFVRALEGRAIQDVFVVPHAKARNRDAMPSKGNRYGTTLRVYDPKNDAWNLTWFNPVTQAENHLIGKRVGKEIVHTGHDSEGSMMRWTFAKITPSAFAWKGESSRDGGRTWRLEAEFFGTRSSPSNPVQAHSTRIRNILWSSPDGNRLEHVTLFEEKSGFKAEGIILRRQAPIDVQLRYVITGDGGWNVRSIGVRPVSGEEPGLFLEGDGTGGWFGPDGKRITSLEGCLDVDIAASPFTNTIAIRRLRLERGGTKDIRVAFVSVSELAATSMRQRYTRLTIGDDRDVYRYESGESKFTADLPVDADGILLEYPGYFKRVWNSEHNQSERK